MVQKKKISYSSKISHYNDKVKDYLIVHELAHHIEPNHSSEFWKIVEKHCPMFKELRKQLRNNQSMVE